MSRDVRKGRAMLGRGCGWVAVALAVLVPVGADSVASGRDRDNDLPAASSVPRSASFVSVVFEVNRGQTDPAVRFLARARGLRAFLTDDEAVFVLPRGTGRALDPLGCRMSASGASDVVRMGFPGASRPTFAALDPLPGRSHYLRGNVPSKWVTDVPHFGAVRGRGLWPGIDLRWRGAPARRLAYDFLVAPGADPGAITLAFDGAVSMEVDGTGDLLLRMEGGVLRHRRPIAWQETAQGRRPVEVAFAVRGKVAVGFAVGPVDRRLPLVIDPTLEYGSFLGASGSDDATGVACDGARSIYLTGATTSTSFPVKNAYKSTFGGEANDAFVTKVAADGSATVYSTYLGGAGQESGYAIDVDGDGAAYVTGFTGSTNFPVAGAYQASHPSPGANTAFVTKLSAAGSSLVYSTYLGGSSAGSGTGIAVDGQGAAYVVGDTQSTNFPFVSGYQTGSGGGMDAFVTKLAASGASLLWSTYLGGSSSDGATCVALDGDGDPYVAGFTQSTVFPTLNPLQGSIGGSRDAFVAKFPAAGGFPEWATYLGGTGQDLAKGIGVSAAGSAWVAGNTQSSDFPLESPIRDVFAGTSEVFVTRISAEGDALLASTYLGGGGEDLAGGIAVTPGGLAFVVGATASADFLLVDPIDGTFNGGGYDAWAACIGGGGTSLLWSTYCGGSEFDLAFAVTVDSASATVVAGTTYSANFPVPGAFQASKGTGTDAFVLRIEGGLVAPAECSAMLTGLSKAEVSWGDDSPNETGFDLERRVDAGAFESLATPGPDTTLYEDDGLMPSTTYTYRVRARKDLETTDWSEECSVTTPPPPVFAPDAPSDLAAVAAGPRGVDLAWQDNSDNEDFFVLVKADGTGPLFATRATPGLGDTDFSDGAVLPGRTYSYKVRAVNPIGPSALSNVVTLTMPTTLEVALSTGKSVDRASLGRDVLKASGTLGFGPDSLITAIDPVATGISVRLGDFTAGALVNVPALDEGWTLRRGRYTWRSPADSVSRSKIVLDTVAGTWKVKVTKFSYATPPANPIRVTLGVGTEAGTAEADWTPGRRAGQFKYP